MSEVQEPVRLHRGLHGVSFERSGASSMNRRAGELALPGLAQSMPTTAP
jgi:hypothetical protein